MYRNPKYPDQTIELETIAQGIDRIQISIRNHGKSAYALEKLLSERFSRFKPHKVKKRGGELMSRYEYLSYFDTLPDTEQSITASTGSRLSLIIDKGYWSRLILSDPGPETQSVVRDILIEAIPAGDATISQIEFALDFYPTDPNEMESLRYYFHNFSVMKHSRGQSSHTYRNTM